jgi:hypothetical protein
MNTTPAMGQVLRFRLVLGVLVGLVATVVIANIGGARADVSNPPSHVLWALVNDSRLYQDNGAVTLVTGQGATGVSSAGLGIYFVTFDEDMTGCAFLASPAILSNGPDGRLRAGGQGNEAIAVGPYTGQLEQQGYGGEDPSKVMVLIGLGRPEIFYLVANCPRGNT